MSRFIVTLSLFALCAACCIPMGEDEPPPPPPAMPTPTSTAPTPPQPPAPPRDMVPRPAATVRAPVTPAPPVYTDAYISAHLTRLSEALRCAVPQAQNLEAHWCAFANAFSTDAASTAFLSAPQILPGVTTWVPTEGDVLTAMQRLKRFSLFPVVSQPVAGAVVVSARPRNPNDQAPAMAVSGVEAHLRGQAGPISLRPGLYGFATGRLGEPLHPMQARGPNTMQYMGGSFALIKRVGTRVYTIEIPARNPQGMWVSIFVDTPMRAAP